VFNLVLGSTGAPPSSVLVIGAHADDIEIGCGGTLLRLFQAYPALNVCWLVLSAPGVRAEEARQSATTWLRGMARHTVLVHDFEDGFLPYDGANVKRVFEDLKGRHVPDLVLTHFRDDRHQDHRLVNELTWNTFRDQLILEYEIPKYDGDFGSPNLFVHLPAEICGRKIDDLMRCFPSQHHRRWFSADVFWAVLRLRGMESNSPTPYAEAFYGRKAVLGLEGDGFS